MITQVDDILHIIMGKMRPRISRYWTPKEALEEHVIGKADETFENKIETQQFQIHKHILYICVFAALFGIIMQCISK